MRRIQIYLDPGRDRHLQGLVEKTGKPKAQLIREGVDLLLEQQGRQTPDALTELVGLAGKAGCPQAAERHDDYVYTAEKPKSGGKKKS